MTAAMYAIFLAICMGWVRRYLACVCLVTPLTAGVFFVLSLPLLLLASGISREMYMGIPLWLGVFACILLQRLVVDRVLYCLIAVIPTRTNQLALS